MACMMPLRPLPGSPAHQRCLSAVPSGRSPSPVEVRGAPQGEPERAPPSPRRAPRWPPEVLRFLEADGAAAALEGGQPPEPASSSRGGWRLAAGACKIPHPAKAERNGGDDSFFIAEGGSAVGVADGVGDWERLAVDPGAVSSELMRGAAEASRRLGGRGAACPRKHAAELLRHGHADVRSYGGTTATIAALNAQGRHVGVANVGDSGFRQVRREPGGGARVVARTREQQHCFNCPFQLSSLPSEADLERLSAEGFAALVEAVRAGILLQDPPSSADLYSFSAQEGDLIVLATDGLYDNLWDSELCELAALAVSPLEAQQAYWEDRAVLRGPATSTDPGKLAAAIAHAAFYRARDPAARTPFQEHAREHGLVHAGGKMDDITVVCAWLVRTRPPSGGEPAAADSVGP